MPYSVFISHSVGSADGPFLAKVADALLSLGVECQVAARDWKFGSSLTELEDAIRGADCVVGVVLAGGAQSAYANQELGIAMDMKKRIFPIAEKGVDLTGFREGLKWAELDRLLLRAHGSDFDPVAGIGTICLNALALWLSATRTK